MALNLLISVYSTLIRTLYYPVIRICFALNIYEKKKKKTLEKGDHMGRR